MLSSALLFFHLQVAAAPVQQDQTVDDDSRARYSAAADYSEKRGGLSMLVSKDGQTVFEKYADGTTAETAHELMSGTKSFWGVLAVAAVEDELLELDELVSDTITEWKEDKLKSAITIRHLLNLSSGLPSARLRFALARNKYETALGIESDRPAGQEFEYGPTNYFVFGEVLRRKLEDQKLDALQYLKRRILEPIGLEVSEWKRDPKENPLMPHGASLTAREWAKFGVFLLRKGKCGERQLIREEALLQCFQPSHANPSYGLTFWLGVNATESLQLSFVDNEGRRERLRKRLIRNREGRGKNIPDELWIAAGKGNQRLYVLPTRGLVIVRQGEDERSWSDLEFLEFFFP